MGRSKKRSRKRGLSFETALAAIVVLVFGGAAVAALLFARSGGEQPRRAVIVDQLGATWPGSAFIERATSVLHEAGYTIDYVPPEEVTIEMYRALPRMGYDLIVLRSHAASYSQDNEQRELSDSRGVALFTNEPYSTHLYVEEQRKGAVAMARQYEGSEPFFALDARFVDSMMEGTFGRATIVLLGCAGLRSPVFAAALHRRGAGQFVSWSDDVNAEFNDRAGALLIASIVNYDGDMASAIQATMAEVGPDPAFGSVLLSSP